MVKLYYTSTSCGAASFIAARAAGITIDAEQVNIGTHVTDGGADFYQINKNGNVPTLVLDDGTVLNEGAAVLQWIADQAPGKIAPVNGSTGRYLVINALNYVATELHKGTFGPLFNPKLPERDFFVQAANNKLKSVNELLADNVYLVGDQPSIADFYLYIVFSWSPYVGLDLSLYPNIAAFTARIGALDYVVKAHADMATKPTTTA